MADNFQNPAYVQESESDNNESHYDEYSDERESLTENENVEEEAEDFEEFCGDGNGGAGCKFDDAFAVNGREDIVTKDFNLITPELLMLYHFVDNDVGFMFYNSYASAMGFAARKSKILRNCNDKNIQQTFLCHREGLRHKKLNDNTQRQLRRKPDSRCGCKARCIVHIEHTSGRWYIKMLDDAHNHTMMDKTFSTLLPSHRNMPEYDKFQMMCMRKAGMKMSQIYDYLADKSGGYENLGYIKRDMYNEQVRQKRSQFTDAKNALDFLEELQKKDEMLFWKHTVDDKGRLEHLFWCDGVGRRDFSIFGDVLAFDATYKKNTYLCPFVVFSGVNHHNQSNVFATAIVVNETEEKYVWVLKQFLTAMDGKTPVSVITDGCPAMRNAIKKVFPSAHHRLCAWHLLKNATSNIKKPKFAPKFRQCMLGDYDVREFECKWENLVEDFGLQENKWMKEMYAKRHMWAAAHIRGNFFAGFRTTSHCESLNSEFGKYVNCQDNLLEFLQNYFRWLNEVRFREVEAGFLTARGDLEPETQLRSLEKSAVEVYTREIFLLFRLVLQRGLTYKVVGIRETGSCYIYTVCKYGREDVEWCVTFSEASLEFKCSCVKLESVGIPCEHLVTVMVHLNIVNMPDCIIYKRWTKNAKDSIVRRYTTLDVHAPPELIYEYMGLVERGRRLAKAAIKCGNPQHIRNTIEIVTKQTEFLEAMCIADNPAEVDNGIDQLFEGPIRNPLKARHKGCGSSTPDSQSQKAKRARKCGVCGYYGHTRKSCHLQRQMDFATQSHSMSNNVNEDHDGGELN